LQYFNTELSTVIDDNSSLQK